ncbi:hypothetical protein [Methylorubrum zatmanii]|uniref:Uncharacterized protein n=1 Tax=Methylorubrum zatmanii TaxID=29429 RepID=A0ABW1WMS7_9HYPH|nr:hypothetical protein [Methylorubrum zatmanii]MBD8906550.1 hypothetical protein [Methylorubrum zatmanii]
MATGKQQMKDLEALRDRLKAQIAELQQQLSGVEMAIRVVTGEPTPQARPRAPRSNVKTYILTLLEEAGARGLNAASAVETAQSRGDQLERGSVSSLLSRLKSDGVVTYDGQLYRLSKYASGASGEAPDFTSQNPFH